MVETHGWKTDFPAGRLSNPSACFFPARCIRGACCFTSRASTTLWVLRTSAASMEERDAIGHLAFSFRGSQEAKFVIFLLFWCCVRCLLQQKMLSNYKTKLPGEVLDRSTTRRKRERKKPVTMATHMWAPKQGFCNTHTHPAQMSCRRKMLPATHS